MTSSPWCTTEELCRELAISRSTLFALRKSGLLKPGRHLVPKNPTCRRSRLLWHRHRCSALLRSNASPAPYTTRATEAEIHRVNDILKQAGQR
jgi:hypothetical protein